MSLFAPGVGPALIAGFLLSLSLILAIGAQNAFVLRQGLRREHVFAVCITCAVSDAALIGLGVSGFGLISTRLPWIEHVMRYGGALFLFVYAARNLRQALRAHDALRPAETGSASLRATLLTCLALTWLNPHVYLDTVVLLGSIASQYDDHRRAFGIGAACASFLFFFALGYGARLLRPWFARPAAWRVLDGLVALVMTAIGVSLLLG